MTLPALASVTELNVRLPAELAGTEDDTRAQAALDDASALVRDEAGITWTDDDDELEDVPDIVVTITLEVARRALNRSFVYGAENEDSRDAGLFLKAEEKRRLAAYSVSASSGMWSVGTDVHGIDWYPPLDTTVLPLA